MVNLTPALSTGAAELIRPEQDRAVSPIPLVYIASTSYSGSTLLTLLLNEHPDIVTVGELKGGLVDPSAYQCSCGAVLNECPLWRAVSEALAARELPLRWCAREMDFRLRGRPWFDRIVRARIRGTWFESVRGVLVRRVPAIQSTFSKTRAYNRAVIEAAMQVFRGRIFVDASKDPVRLQYLVHTGDYEVRLIHLIRDGRAVAFSARKNHGEAVESSSRDWLHTHQQIEQLAQVLPARRIFQIRYEDLCAKPVETVSSLFEFLGLNGRSISIDRLSREHHVLGNRMRLQSWRPPAVDEQWRSKLSAADCHIFDAIAGGLNRHYGYA